MPFHLSMATTFFPALSRKYSHLHIDPFVEKVALKAIACSGHGKMKMIRFIIEHLGLLRDMSLNHDGKILWQQNSFIGPGISSAAP